MDFLLRITMESPDSRVRAGQGPKHASWEGEYPTEGLWWSKIQVFSPRKLEIFSLKKVPVSPSSNCKHRQCLLKITLRY